MWKYHLIHIKQRTLKNTFIYQYWPSDPAVRIGQKRKAICLKRDLWELWNTPTSAMEQEGQVRVIKYPVPSREDAFSLYMMTKLSCFCLEIISSCYCNKRFLYWKLDWRAEWHMTRCWWRHCFSLQSYSEWGEKRDDLWCLQQDRPMQGMHRNRNTPSQPGRGYCLPAWCMTHVWS